jgi:RNA-directed DNA polymerase
LGIPTAVDRFIQQAVLQVLQPEWEQTFSEYSYGFRPERSAHQAIAKAQEHINAGYEVVVDIDLEKFFDRVNHDVLMSRVARRVVDKRVLQLIRGYLNSGVLENGLVSPTDEGTPQGGPLSPLLSNLLLDELDKELEQRGHRFVRYADDCNIYVRSERAGERVMAGTKRFLERRLRLKVNEQKSAVGKPSERKFLGYSFTSEAAVRRKIAKPSGQQFKERVRELTKRGRNLQLVVTDLTRYLRGWAGYYGWCETKSQLRELDGWTRRRLRRYIWRQWQRPGRRYRILRRHDVPTRQAWHVVHFGPWRASRSQGPQPCPSQRLLSRAGTYVLSWLTLLFSRTALYGPVCGVVWEGGAARLLPIPIDECQQTSFSVRRSGRAGCDLSFKAASAPPNGEERILLFQNYKHLAPNGAKKVEARSAAMQ